MRPRTLTTSASALLLFIASLASANKQGIHDHLEALHRRHRAQRDRVVSTPEDGQQGIELPSPVPETVVPEVELKRRGGQCAFPTGAGLVAVTPNEENAGWAMSPDQPCLPGSYCPYACPPGQVSMQWDPKATSYTYPQSMNGGLYCDENGNINKPFPNQPYCQSTATNIGVVNNAAGVVSFCQTVLPGNEAMLIPNAIQGSGTLAMPGMNYWCSTAAHYYINPPGIGAEEACVWGSHSNPYGNWSPYVAGGNVDASGSTFIKLGWNPIYLETTTPFRNTMPTWGVKIDCPNGGCSGLPCAIDPTQNKVNQMVGSSSNGAGGGAFCVVTVEAGSTANFVVYETGGSTTGSVSSISSVSSSSGSGSSSVVASSLQSASSGNGGQFYQQTATSTSSAARSTSTLSAISSAASAESSTSWSSQSALEITTSNNGTTVSSTASTTGRVPLPTNSPYFSIFNHTTYSTASTSIVAPILATPSGPSVSPSQLPKTGAAPAIDVGMLSAVSAVAIGLAALL